MKTFNSNNILTYVCEKIRSGLHTSLVDEHISIKPISEENYILLVSEVNIRPCEEVREEAAWTQCNSFNGQSQGQDFCFSTKDELHINMKVPGVVGEELQVVHLW